MHFAHCLDDVPQGLGVSHVLCTAKLIMFVEELTVQIVTKGAQSAILRVDQGTVGTRTMEQPVQPLPLVNDGEKGR